MKNSEYWEDRIANSTWTTYNNLEEKNRALLEMYQDASRAISDELYSLTEKMQTATPSLSDMHKYNRLTGLRNNMENIIRELGENVEKFGKENMFEGFKETYSNIMVQLGKLEFDEVPKKVMEEMLNRPWQGSNFSERLWKNTQVLANNLNEILVNGLTQGKTVTEMAIQLTNTMNTSFNISHRLIRTETMHYLNESAFKGYEDAGCGEVELWAAEDERTCEVCGAKHGTKYKIKDRPILPLHANCRCTYLPVVDIEGDKVIKFEGKVNDKEYTHNTSSVKWEEYLDINKGVSDRLNDIHTDLNKFMIENKKEKLSLLKISDNNILVEQVGELDTVKLSKETVKMLKHTMDNDIIFVHNHPGKTTFSRYDIDKIIRFKSIKTMTLECSDGSKYILDRGQFTSSLFDRMKFEDNYHKIYYSVARKYPELDDEVKIYDVWDKFLDNVNKKVAQHYGMIYRKVE